VNRLVLTVASISILILVLWNHQDEQKIKHQQTLGKVVVFGDSLVSGYGSTPGKNYPNYLDQLLPGNVIAVGRNGDTVAKARERAKDVIKHSPSAVIVTLGGNDILQGVPLDQTLDHLKQLFTLFQEQGIMVFYTGINPPFVSDDRSEAIQELCFKMEVGYIPDVMNELWLDPTLMSDRIHPNSRGYQRIAQKVYDALQEMVEE
jgi:acyl-CoA thioesterase-1